MLSLEMAYPSTYDAFSADTVIYVLLFYDFKRKLSEKCWLRLLSVATPCVIGVDLHLSDEENISKLDSILIIIVNFDPE